VPNARVFVSLLDDSQEYQRIQAEEARSAGARSGLEVEVQYTKGDPALQMKQLGDAVQVEASRRPVAVVLHPVAVAGLEALARSMLRAGVGWVSLDQAFYLPAIQRDFPDRLVALVSTDNREIGRLQAKLFRALLPAGGSVVYVEGPSLSPPVIHRREGMKEGLMGSRVGIVKTLTGDWSEASAERAMSFWLRVGAKTARPALVGAQNDLMAAGARKAMLALRPEWRDVPFTGCDGLPGGGIRQVREKALAATVVQPLTAGPAVELVARSLRGEKVPAATHLAPRIYPSLEELERRARTPGNR
jgi:ribose transport system substrate-binding protein